MGSIIRFIYKGMLGNNKALFKTKFMIMYDRKKDKQWDLLRKLKLIEESSSGEP